MKKLFPLVVVALCVSTAVFAQQRDTTKVSRLSIGGYGEVALSRNFYSDNVYRYTSASKHTDESHNRFDVPHAVIYLGYDFGKGWSMQTEIEFEHLGTGTEIEKEFEEAGEWESETERGGEVELEQFWIQKSFKPWLNVRMGHMVVPVGGLNNRHEPLNFFTVYRPEGEYTILPSTWHDTGIGLWGTYKTWRYEVMMVSGLDAMMFSRDNFIGDGANTPFEFQVANHPGFAARIDKKFGFGLDLGLSSYIGNTFNNTFPYEVLTNETYTDVKGTVFVAALDWRYRSKNLIIRGNADFGSLSDAKAISKYKSSKGAADYAPYDDTPVGDKAVAVGMEAGYNIFSLINIKDKDQKFYVFARGEYYNPYIAQSGQGTYGYTEKTRIAMGINWYPIPEIAVKAEYSHRFLSSEYNNEPSISLGIAYQGFFKR